MKKFLQHGSATLSRDKNNFTLVMSIVMATDNVHPAVGSFYFTASVDALIIERFRTLLLKLSHSIIELHEYELS